MKVIEIIKKKTCLRNGMNDKPFFKRNILKRKKLKIHIEDVKRKVLKSKENYQICFTFIDLFSDESYVPGKKIYNKMY